MAIDGPINIKRMKEYLQNANPEELDELIKIYLNAFLIQQRIIIAIGRFDTNQNLSPHSKTVLGNLFTAANLYVDNFDNKLLLTAIEVALAVLYSEQGYVVNISRQSKACQEIYNQIFPIKQEVAGSVSIESFIDSFVFVEKDHSTVPLVQPSSTIPNLVSAPPPPPPPPRKEKEPIPAAAKSKTVVIAEKPKEELTCKDELLRKLHTIDQELTLVKGPQNKTETEEVKPIPRLALNLKRELTTKALDAERRRNLKRFADVRSDPTLPSQLNPNSSSKGQLFLSMLRSQIGERKEKTLKAAAAQQKTSPAMPASNTDVKDMETSFQKLLSN